MGNEGILELVLQQFPTQDKELIAAFHKSLLEIPPPKEAHHLLICTCEKCTRKSKNRENGTY
jgi:hypothetical protein